MKQLMIKRGFAAIVFSALSLFATEYQLELGLNSYAPSGDVEYGSSDSASQVDIKDDMGLGGNQFGYKPALYITSKDHKMGASFETISFDDTNNLDRDILFDDKTYTAGTNAQSTLEMDEIQLMYRYLLTKRSDRRLGLGVDLNLIDLTVKMDNGSNNGSYKASVAMPALAIEYEYYINKTVGIEAKLAGFTTGDNAGYLEYYVGTKLQNLLIDGGYWRIGYAQKHINIDENRFEGNIAMKGFYLNYGLNFRN